MSSESAVFIGNRRELFVDTWLIDDMSGGVALHLHQPLAREVALITDKPWEGNMCGYVTVFQDGSKYRMYYRTGRFDPQRGLGQPHGTVIAYAESSDGLHWWRPEIGLYNWAGSSKNNIVWRGGGADQKGIHGFAPFRDTRPGVATEARYKAMGSSRTETEMGLYAMASPDGIHWSLLDEQPVLRGCAFDSQNLGFWDTARGEYRAYVRDFRNGLRGIRTCTSQDFIHWTDPEWLGYPHAPHEQLYTNQVLPYYRAPHLLVGFPTRYVERAWSPAIEALPELEHRRLRASLHPRFGTALTDGLFMSSRDRRTFRRWPEAFIRPGPQQEGNWAYGDNYQCWGMIETPSDLHGAPLEISFLVTEHYWRGDSTVFRRHTLRVDGFVSLRASMSAGTVLTKPFRFQGSTLFLNVSTSAAGGVWVEIQSADGQPVENYSLDTCHEVVGDELDKAVTWRNGDDVAALAGMPVRLRFVLKDADLYAMRFG